MDKTEFETKLHRVKKIFLNMPVIKGNNGYPYVLFSLTDFVPPMDPNLVEDMADLIINSGNFENVDIIISEADRGGGPLAHAIARKVKLPYVLANWYSNGLKGQIKVKTKIGFSGDGYIYINGLTKGQRAVIVDDLLSTGGTSDAIIKALKQKGIKVVGALFVGEKIGVGGRQLIERHNVPITSLVKFGIKNGVTVEL